jgi:hypothetical protein
MILYAHTQKFRGGKQDSMDSPLDTCLFIVLSTFKM